MNIVQFLDEVGHTRLRFQYLHECISNASAVRGHTKVTFGTAEFHPSDLVGKPSRVGVIVWMDASEFERAQASVKGST